MKEVIKEAINLLEDGQPGVLATVVRTKGSTPQKPGAMLLIRQEQPDFHHAIPGSDQVNLLSRSQNRQEKRSITFLEWPF